MDLKNYSDRCSVILFEGRRAYEVFVVNTTHVNVAEMLLKYYNNRDSVRALILKEEKGIINRLGTSYLDCEYDKDEYNSYTVYKNKNDIIDFGSNNHAIEITYYFDGKDWFVKTKDENLRLKDLFNTKSKSKEGKIEGLNKLLDLSSKLLVNLDTQRGRLGMPQYFDLFNRVVLVYLKEIEKLKVCKMNVVNFDNFNSRLKNRKEKVRYFNLGYNSGEDSLLVELKMNENNQYVGIAITTKVKGVIKEELRDCIGKNESNKLGRLPNGYKDLVYLSSGIRL